MKARHVVFQGESDLRASLAALVSEEFQPTLAVVFGSVALDLEGAVRVFRAAGLDVLAASSSGEIAAPGEADDCVFEQSLVALILDLPREAYRLQLIDAAGRTSGALGEAAGQWARQAFARPGLIALSAGLMMDGEQVVNGSIRGAGGVLPFFGGLAGDDLRMQQTVVFVQDERSDHGLALLALDQEQVVLSAVSASGWRGIGLEKTVTRAEGNVVFEIDGKPATEVYREYLQMIGQESIPRNAEYPLEVTRREGQTVLRAAMMVDATRQALVYAGTVEQGAHVRFANPPGEEIITCAKEEVDALKRRQPAADALLLFSCKARHLALGPMVEDEILHMQQAWQVPLVGYFTYGEFGTTRDGHPDFFNDTCVLVALASP